MRRMLLILCVSWRLCRPCMRPKSQTTEDLVRDAKKYGKSWYKTATFVQKKPRTSTKTESRLCDLSKRCRCRESALDFCTDEGMAKASSFANRTIYSFKDGKGDKGGPSCIHSDSGFRYLHAACRPK